MTLHFQRLLSIILIFITASLPLKAIASEIITDHNIAFHLTGQNQINNSELLQCDQCCHSTECNTSGSASPLLVALLNTHKATAPKHFALKLYTQTTDISLRSVSVLVRPPKV